MSKAFFLCTPGTWKALNEKHNNGALCFVHTYVLILINSLFLMRVLVANIVIVTALVVVDVDVDADAYVAAPYDVVALVTVAPATVIVAHVLLLVSLSLLSYYYC